MHHSVGPFYYVKLSIGKLTLVSADKGCVMCIFHAVLNLCNVQSAPVYIIYPNLYGSEFYITQQESARGDNIEMKVTP